MPRYNDPPSAAEQQAMCPDVRPECWEEVEALVRDWIAARKRHDQASVESYEAEGDPDAFHAALGRLDQAAGEMMRLEWRIVKKCWQIVDPADAPKGGD